MGCRSVCTRWTRSWWLALAAGAALFVPGTAPGQARTGASASAATYWPGRGNDWERRSPARVGMDAARIEEAIAFVTAPERKGVPEDLERHLRLNFSAREPYGDLIGPVKSHGPPTGVIVRHGYIVAEWGDPQRIDMTFSVSKSFVSVVWGLAYDRGLIRDVHDRVVEYVRDGTFDSPRNSKITWDMLLRKTSEWEGELWGIPTWSDRYAGKIRELQEPGTYYEYNDVRVNVLAYALLRVWRRPLPQVLREYVMDPLGAVGWEWHGYRNSWVTIDGMRMQSVSGGGHWGGGMFISALDMARFGLLHLRDGRWKDRQILSEAYLKLAKTPGKLNPGGFGNYGLNTGRRAIPAASEAAHWHSGHGPNRIFVDPKYDLVVVTRWTEGFNEFIEKVISSIDPRTVTTQN